MPILSTIVCEFIHRSQIKIKAERNQVLQLQRPAHLLLVEYAGLDVGLQELIDGNGEDVLQGEVYRFQVIFKHQDIAVPVDPAKQVFVDEQLQGQSVFEQVSFRLRGPEEGFDTLCLVNLPVKDPGELGGGEPQDDPPTFVHGAGKSGGEEPQQGGEETRIQDANLVTAVGHPGAVIVEEPGGECGGKVKGNVVAKGDIEAGGEGGFIVAEPGKAVEEEEESEVMRQGVGDPEPAIVFHHSTVFELLLQVELVYLSGLLAVDQQGNDAVHRISQGLRDPEVDVGGSWAGEYPQVLHQSMAVYQLLCGGSACTLEGPDQAQKDTI